MSDVKKRLQKIFDKLGRTGFLTLCFLPFGAWGLYHHGWKGLLTAMFGWWLGNVIYKRFLEKRFFNDTPRRVR